MVTGYVKKEWNNGGRIALLSLAVNVILAIIMAISGFAVSRTLAGIDGQIAQTWASIDKLDARVGARINRLEIDFNSNINNTENRCMKGLDGHESRIQMLERRGWYRGNGE